MQLTKITMLFVTTMLGLSATSCKKSKSEYQDQDVAKIVNNSDAMVTLHYREACDEGCTDEFSTEEISAGETVIVYFSFTTQNAYSGSRGTRFTPVKIDISAKSGEIVACEASPFPDMAYGGLDAMEEVSYTLLSAGEDCPQDSVSVELVK